MLWSKESNANDAIYIDITQDPVYSKVSFTNHKKNNNRSVSARSGGNFKVSTNNYSGAINSYNESIRFAESSDCLSLAYANRSYCFFKLECFDRCLKDIELAIKNQYPENLLQKLLNRKQACMVHLQQQTQPICSEPKLSYDPHSNIPCMVNVLKLEVNARYGRLIKADCNIGIGETLLIEEAYIRVSTGNECYNCAKQKSNLIPCATCPDVMFCSEDCSKNTFHVVECNVIFHSDESFGAKSSSLILHSVMAGISSFDSIDDMMRFVDICRSTEREEISTLSTPQSKYRSFFKLSSFGNIGDVRDQAMPIFHVMMRSTVLANRFDSQKKKRFLAHLICHHALIVRTNAFGGASNSSGEMDFERNIFLATSYFNHSCLPNVTKLSKGNFAVVTAIQPISKGQQLFITYLTGELIEQTNQERNNVLENAYGFRCNCELCTIGVQSDARILEKDNDFLFVAKNIENYQSIICNIKECCIKFIQKHCDKLASEPGYFILTSLTAMLQKELEAKQ